MAKRKKSKDTTKTQGNARLMRKDIYGLTKEEEMIAFYRKYPVAAAEDLLGFTGDMRLTWYQRRIIRAAFEKPYVFMKAGRGSAKSFGAAIILVTYALLYPEKRIGIVAPTGRQTGYVFDDIERLFRQSPFMRAATVGGKISRGTDKSIIKFTNGSFIEGLPIGVDGATIRGRRYFFVFLDEEAFHNQETIDNVVIPFMAVQDGDQRNKLLIASTPKEKTNHFYNRYVEYLQGSFVQPDDYAFFSFNYLDVLIDNHPRYKYDTNLVEKQYRQQPLDQFMMEWGGYFPDTSSAFFSSQLISNCEPRGQLHEGVVMHEIAIEENGDPLAEYVMGIDPARSESGDNFALTIIKIVNKGMRHVVKVVAKKGISYPDMHKLIREHLHLKGFAVTKICLDAGSGGGGRALADLMLEGWYYNGMHYPPIGTMKDVEDKNEYDAKKILPILELINFSIPTIDHMYTTLRADMEHRTTLFPVTVRRDLDPYKEVNGLEFAMLKAEMQKLTPIPSTRGLTFEGDATLGKDRITSCVLANLAAHKVYGQNLDTSADDTDYLSDGVWL